MVLGIGQTFGEVAGPPPQKTISAAIPADNSPLQKATAGLMSVGGLVLDGSVFQWCTLELDGTDLHEVSSFLVSARAFRTCRVLPCGECEQSGGAGTDLRRGSWSAFAEHHPGGHLRGQLTSAEGHRGF